MAEDFTGQVAVVTGGGRGIGKTITLGLAQAGASVAITGRSAGPLEETVRRSRPSASRRWRSRPT